MNIEEIIAILQANPGLEYKTQTQSLYYPGDQSIQEIVEELAEELAEEIAEELVEAAGNEKVLFDPKNPGLAFAQIREMLPDPSKYKQRGQDTIRTFADSLVGINDDVEFAKKVKRCQSVLRLGEAFEGKPKRLYVRFYPDLIGVEPVAPEHRALWCETAKKVYRLWKERDPAIFETIWGEKVKGKRDVPLRDLFVPGLAVDFEAMQYVERLWLEVDTVLGIRDETGVTMSYMDEGVLRSYQDRRLKNGPAVVAWLQTVLPAEDHVQPPSDRDIVDIFLDGVVQGQS